MTREEKMEMFAMRLDGRTLQEIGDKYGLTRERVRQILPNYEVKRKGNKTLRTTGYVNISKHLTEKGITLKNFAEILGVEYSTLRMYLNGKREFSISQIRKIIEVTGMSFEDAFLYEVKEDKLWKN